MSETDTLNSGALHSAARSIPKYGLNVWQLIRALKKSAASTVAKAVIGVKLRASADLPPDKASVLTILPAAPRFQCSGNDFEYDAAGGTLSLLINDPGSCQ